MNPVQDCRDVPWLSSLPMCYEADSHTRPPAPVLPDSGNAPRVHTWLRHGCYLDVDETMLGINTCWFRLFPVFACDSCKGNAHLVNFLQDVLE
jgi:hypothetical protein